MNCVYNNMIAGAGSRSLVTKPAIMAEMIELLTRKIISDRVDYVISGKVLASLLAVASNSDSQRIIFL